MQRNVRRAQDLVGGMDLWLILAFLGLMCVGVMMVYSASIKDAYAFYGSQYYVVQRELFWVAAGFISLVFTASFPYHRWKRPAPALFALAILLLVLVLVPHVGHLVNGARRWFSVGSNVSIEPSEFAKLAMILYLAVWLPTKGAAIQDLKTTFIPFSVMIGTMFLFILKQPDLGTGIVLTTTAFSVFFVAGANLRHMVIVAVGSSVFAWGLIHFSSYRQNRLTAFIDPWQHPTGVGFHTVHALLALGNGGILGQGLGNSVQKWILPAPHTDSILAVIGEELGFVGTVGVLCMYLMVAYRGMRISSSAPDPFGRLVAAGITSWIMIQALLNYAVITSSVPFTGVPLPFISYGGTSLIITMAAVGILLNISRYATGEGIARQNTDNGGGDGRPRLSRSGGHASPRSSTRKRAAGRASVSSRRAVPVQRDQRTLE